VTLILVHGSHTPLKIGLLIFGWHNRAVCKSLSQLDAPASHNGHRDAFALNIGHEDWQKARVLDGYAAALQLRTEFKLFLSFDMT
jgi:hypothetical protein